MSIEAAILVGCSIIGATQILGAYVYVHLLWQVERSRQEYHDRIRAEDALRREALAST